MYHKVAILRSFVSKLYFCPLPRSLPVAAGHAKNLAPKMMFAAMQKHTFGSQTHVKQTSADDAIEIAPHKKPLNRDHERSKIYPGTLSKRGSKANTSTRTLRRAKVFQDDLELVEGGALAVALPHHGAQLFEIPRESHLEIARRGA